MDFIPQSDLKYYILGIIAILFGIIGFILYKDSKKTNTKQITYLKTILFIIICITILYFLAGLTVNYIIDKTNNCNNEAQCLCLNNTIKDELNTFEKINFIINGTDSINSNKKIKITANTIKCGIKNIFE